MQTEHDLSKLSIPPEEIKALHNKFLIENDIQHHLLLPELQLRIAQDQSHSNPSITHHKRRRPKRKCPTEAPQPKKKQSKQDPFLSKCPPNPHHYLDSTQLQQCNILTGRARTIKDLLFVPTPTLSSTKTHLHILQAFDTFAKSLRQKYYNAKYRQFPPPQPVIHCPTAHIQRRMKFIPTIKRTSHVQNFSGIITVEHYIALTKNNLNEQLPLITTNTTSNVTPKHMATIKRLKQIRNTLTIKPANKNLGIVILNTDDYIAQCMQHWTQIPMYQSPTSLKKKSRGSY